MRLSLRVNKVEGHELSGLSLYKCKRSRATNPSLKPTDDERLAAFRFVTTALPKSNDVFAFGPEPRDVSSPLVRLKLSRELGTIKASIAAAAGPIAGMIRQKLATRASQIRTVLGGSA